MKKKNTILKNLIKTYNNIELELQESRLYVLIRNDLSKSQKIVQTAHAVADLILYGNKKDWNNGIIICQKVRNEKELLEYKDKLIDMKLDWVSFNEEDMSNQTTAIAFISKKEKLFPELPLT